MEPDTMRRLEAAVEELAAREYPQVWIGEEGMTPEESLEGLWVIENMRDDLDDTTEAELHREVLHIYAAKRGEVLVITDSRELYEADLPPKIRRVSLNELAPEDAGDVLEGVEFYATEGSAPMGPYIIEDSEKARAALEKRLGA
jgi:hypothetical protein